MRHSIDAFAKEVRPYVRQLGLDLTPKETKATGECPFCDKNTFSVDNETSKFICGRCKVSGNLQTFVRELYERSPVEPNDLVRQLAVRREIQPSTLRAFGVRPSLIDGKPLIPLFNSEDKLVNVMYEAEIETSKGKKLRPICIEGLGIHLIGYQRFDANIRRVWIVEGPWKVFAWQELLNSLKAVKRNGSIVYVPTDNPDVSLGRDTIVVGVIGVRSYNERWADLFPNREVIIAFDNDAPKQQDGNGKVYSSGWEWALRTATKITSPKKRLLCWGKGGYDETLADSYDLRNLRKDKGDAEAYVYARKHLIEPPSNAAAAEVDPGIEPAECRTFKELEEIYKEVIYFPKPVRQTLATTLAVILSTEARDDHLWFRIIGPPGSGKSTIAEACSAAQEYVYPVSKVKGFHSGYVLPGQRRNKDNSLIPLINGKTVFWKDADTLISSSNRDEIMAELRDLYDSTARTSFRNGVHNSYQDLRITFILSGTQVLRGLNDSMLGERFLDIEIFEEGDTREYVKRAFKNGLDELRSVFSPPPEGEADDSVAPTKMRKLKEYTYGYLKHLKENHRRLGFDFNLPKEIENRIEQMAVLLSFVRARPPKAKKNEEATYKTRQELATRLTKQFLRHAVCLAMVYNKTSIDKDVQEDCLKVMENTAEGYHFDLLKLLRKYPDGASVETLCRHLALPRATTDKIIADMQHFKVIQRNDRPNGSGIGGRDRHHWLLTRPMEQLFNAIYGKVQKDEIDE
jgi:hypothetical protein